MTIPIAPVTKKVAWTTAINGARSQYRLKDLVKVSGEFGLGVIVMLVLAQVEMVASHGNAMEEFDFKVQTNSGFLKRKGCPIRVNARIAH